MFQWIKKAFSTPRIEDYKPHKLMPRVVDISGVKFHFSMPENFSLDMPADDLVEHVNLSQYENMAESGAIQLMKRWWDFYNGKPHPRNTVGTLMLSLDILKKPSNIDGSLFSHEPMVNSIHQNTLRTHEVSTAEEARQKGIEIPESTSEMREFKRNGFNWVNGFEGYVGNSMSGVNIFYTPVSENWYLRAWFLFSIGDRKCYNFAYDCARLERLRILDSFCLDFPFSIPEREAVENRPSYLPPKEQIEKTEKILESMRSLRKNN
ncbi:hypothetical protein [Marinibactrum halimedae]|uniref:Uncharacterized protein n=1 Tax=Marinibactrum halimedae TaxID=1444977 RepID=A0AA37T771_9GAMM|nr:hypothetical protein [Marinibactrum halimedae]MCD9458112.1 hypothetical protein [Marinibactrum halimedae]GLS25046.1 hypothetical protein GCM10007877_07600 [Marinibactrum halimedae]